MAGSLQDCLPRNGECDCLILVKFRLQSLHPGRLGTKLGHYEFLAVRVTPIHGVFLSRRTRLVPPREDTSVAIFTHNSRITDSRFFDATRHPK